MNEQTQYVKLYKPYLKLRDSYFRIVRSALALQCYILDPSAPRQVFVLGTVDSLVFLKPRPGDVAEQQLVDNYNTICML